MAREKAIDVAREFGEQLPSFPSLDVAERHFEAYQQACLDSLEAIVPDLAGFAMDYSPESLKALEDVYFNQVASGGFARLGLTQEDFESLIGVYFGSVAIRNDPRVQWVVSEFAFMPGKYELGVAKGSVTVMVVSFRNLNLLQPGKKRRDRIYRMY